MLHVTEIIELSFITRQLVNIKGKNKYLEKMDFSYNIYSYKGRMAPDISAIGNKFRSISSIFYTNLNLFLMAGAVRVK